MIYDCFLFFNELDILEIRFHVLDEIVDKFVLVEATRTYSNNPKPLYFEENKDRYSRFLHKIIHVVVDDYPPFINAWTNDIHQRNCISRGLTECQPEDLILISDADEILNPACIKKYRHTQEMLMLECLQFNYFLNYFCVTDPFWCGAKMGPYALVKGRSIQDVRSDKNVKIAELGGWHFSYMGGIDKVILKTESFAHQEYNNEYYKNRKRVQDRIAQGKDIYGKPHRFKLVAFDINFPEYVLENRVNFEHIILSEEGKPVFNISDLLTHYYKMSRLKKYLFLDVIKNTWKTISFKRYDRRGVLKKVLPRFFHFLLDKESIKLERRVAESVQEKKDILN